MDQYYRYHALTAGARKRILAYNWPGNSIQLKAFCERMVLTVGRRTITEEYVAELLAELYQNTKEPDYYTYHGIEPPQENHGEKPAKAETNAAKSERDVILENLRASNGSRTLTAKKMNISTTTLWRKMKKYNIE